VREERCSDRIEGLGIERQGEVHPRDLV
jgi:hypothetical protein